MESPRTLMAKPLDPRVILIGTGSELSLCVFAHEELTAAGVRSRVVSMPCCELFDEQPQAYRDEVLPPNVTARVAVEAGIAQPWHRYLGSGGVFVGLDDFGASGPGGQLMEHFGLTPQHVLDAANRAIAVSTR